MHAEALYSPVFNLSHLLDAYKGGEVFQTGNRLYDISASGLKMTFKYEQTNEAAAPPVDTPADKSATSDTVGSFLVLHFGIIFLLVHILD